MATSQIAPRSNPSPKNRFQEIPNAIAAHRRMVDLVEFERAIHYAELEYTATLCRLAPSSISESSSEIAAAACFQRVMGMNEFIRTLRNLSEKAQPPLARPSDNLDPTK